MAVDKAGGSTKVAKRSQPRGGGGAVSKMSAAGASTGAGTGATIDSYKRKAAQSAAATGAASNMLGVYAGSPMPLEDPFGAGAGGGGGGAGGGGAAGALGGAGYLDPTSNPEYLAALAALDAQEAAAISSARAKQDAARRALDDLLGDIAEREEKSSENTRYSQENRGLLRSGATERLLAEVAKQAGADRARGQAATADQVSELERQIAEARAAAARNRSQLALQFADLPAVV